MHFIFFLKTKLKILFFPKISRISIHIYTNKEINEFLFECINSEKKVGKFFFNLDETFWKNINMIQKTIKIKGEKNNVKINSNEKTGFTLILIISSSGIFMTPILIAKGKII